MTARRLWKVHQISLPGESHLRKVIPCQDASAAGTDESEEWAWAIVADGHGSERHFRSDRGSTFAVEALQAAFQSVQAFAEHPDAASGTVSTARWEDWAAARVLARWRSSVYRDVVSDPPRPDRGENGLERYLDHMKARHGWPIIVEFLRQLDAFDQYSKGARERLANGDALDLPSEADWDPQRLGDWQVTAYGSTLLGVLASPEAIHWFQLGDGAMVKVSGGDASYLVPPPEGAIANETPSLSLKRAVEAVNVGTVHLRAGQIPSALLLSTDGVPNSYEKPAGFFQFCAEVAAKASQGEPIDQGLAEWLPEISRRGSGDDVSVAMIWSTERASAEIVPPKVDPTVRPSSQRARAERAGGEPVPVEPAPVEPAPVERPPVERPPVERPPAQRPPAQRPRVERPPAKRVPGKGAASEVPADARQIEQAKAAVVDPNTTDLPVMGYRKSGKPLRRKRLMRVDRDHGDPPEEKAFDASAVSEADSGAVPRDDGELGARGNARAREPSHPGSELSADDLPHTRRSSS